MTNVRKFGRVQLPFRFAHRVAVVPSVQCGVVCCTARTVVKWGIEYVWLHIRFYELVIAGWPHHCLSGRRCCMSLRIPLVRATPFL